MKLLDVHIDGFGKFHDYSITFQDGINLLYGKNETGKSTLHAFLRAMLFGLERGRGRASKNDLFSKYEPWEQAFEYGGQLRLEHNQQIYRIERSFAKERRSFLIINETLGKELSPETGIMDEILGGLNETTFHNTISIGQLKSATDSGMVTELKNYIANMNTSGSMALNITKATSYLKTKRRELERKLIPDVARNYTTLLSEIKVLEREISAPEYENQLLTFQGQRIHVHSEITKKQDEKEHLIQKIATGKQILSNSQFTDEASVVSYQTEACSIYQYLLVAQTLLERKSRLFIPFLLFASSLFLIGGVVINTITNTYPLLTTFVCAGFSLLFFIWGIYHRFEWKRAKKDYELNCKLLQEILSRHLGDNSISEEAMDSLRKRLEEFIHLCHILTKSEQALQEHTSSISSLKMQELGCEDAITKQQRTQWELEKKLDQLTHLKDQVESLKHALEENEKIQADLAAIDLALETMTALSSSIRDSFGLYLNKSASELIDGITGGIYNSISVDENLNVFMNTPTKLVPIHQVSSGTMDQIYLALRLAAAKLLQTEAGKMPLLFDDSFVLYDDERLKTALAWLASIPQEQLLIFTCHDRESAILLDCTIPHHLIRL